MAVGGLRALLLQALHPLAMAGVAQNSDFRTDPWGRLQRTADYVGVTTYGTTAEAEKLSARIRRIHSHIRGVEPESGEPYRADDPELLRWIHCCEVGSFLTAYQRGGGPLSAEEADTYLGEQTLSAQLVGLDPEEVPATVAELDAYFAAMRPRLRVTAEAREAARFILLPPMPRLLAVGTPARPAWAGLATLAFALLPPWARRMYSLPGLPVTDIAATVAVRGMRTALSALPPALRDGPHVRAAQARMEGTDSIRRLPATRIA